MWASAEDPHRRHLRRILRQLGSKAEGADLSSKIGAGFKSVKRRLRLGLDFSAHKVVSIASVLYGNQIILKSVDHRVMTLLESVLKLIMVLVQHLGNVCYDFTDFCVHVGCAFILADCALVGNLTLMQVVQIHHRLSWRRDEYLFQSRRCILEAL